MRIVLICFFAWFHVVSATTYSVEVKGIYAGEAELIREISETDEYSISLILKPNSIFRLLGIKEMVEKVNGKVIDDALEPTFYERLVGDPDKELKALFLDEEIDLLYKQKKYTLPKQPRLKDPMTQVWQIELDLKRGAGLKPYYPVLTGRRIYMFRSYLKNKNEVILTEENKKERVIHIQFDDDGNLLSLAQIKKKSRSFFMTRKL